MSEQVIYSLKKAGVYVFFTAIVAAVGAGATEVIPLIPDPWGVMLGMTVPPFLRWLEGLQDAKRAARGHVIPADVTYNQPVFTE